MAEADATTRHYADIAARELFRAALQEDQDSTLAAELWSANDTLRENESPATRKALLAICSDAGIEGRAGLPELRTYMCDLNVELAEERPTLASFGPKDTDLEPGDPRRSDVAFVGTAQFLLSMKEDRGWLDAPNPTVALDNRDDVQYQAGLAAIATRCERD